MVLAKGCDSLGACVLRDCAASVNQSLFLTKESLSIRGKDMPIKSKYAKKIIRDLKCILVNWTNPTSEDYSHDYLTLLLLTTLARSSSWQDCELRKKVLLILENNRDEITQIVHHFLMNIVRATSEELDRMQYCGEFLLLSNDKESWEDDLQDAVSSFLVYFSELELICEGLRLSIIEAISFNQEFKKLEQCFKDWFGYFSAYTDMLEKTVEIEPALKNRWWVTEKPDPDKIINRKISSTDFDQVMRLMSGEGFSLSCPDTEVIIKFALEGQVDSSTREHIEGCVACRKLAEDLIGAEKISELFEDAPMPPKLRKAFNV